MGTLRSHKPEDVRFHAGEETATEAHDHRFADDERDVG
jgi:hypothetical protein